MRKKVTQCLLLVVIGVMTLTDTFGQCPFPILTGASTSGNARAPIGTFRFERGHYIITAAEMAAAGYLPGTINTVRWAYTTGNSVSVTGNLAVYFENTSDVTNLKSTTWATAIGTMTNSRPSSSFTLPATPTLTYDVPITTPFTYTGGGLYVAYEWSNAANPLAAAGATVTCNTALNLSLTSAQSNVALPTVTATPFSAFRPITTFFGPTPPNNDIKVDLIYSFGKLANGHSTNHPVRARILNVGNVTQTSIPVTLNVSGLTTFSDVQTIASLAPCTGTTVTFAPYTPVGTGTNTVNVSVPSDDNNANNSKSLTQNVTTQEIAYKDVSQTNSGGVGFTAGTGAFVGKFSTATGGQINEVQVDFTTSGFTYRVGIYGDNAGVPGTLLYTDAVDRTSSLGTAFITLSPTVTVPAGNFYIGIRQTGTNNIGFAFTTESPLRVGDFFYTSPLPETNPWTELSGTGLTFRFNIQAKFYIPAPPSCAASQSPADLSTNNCLNSVLSWASGGGGPTGYKVTFGTNAPNYDNVLNNVDLGNVLTYNPGILTPATTYGYKIVPYNVDGEAVGCTFNTFTTTASGALPFTEDFTSITFPPTCWSNSDPAVIFRSPLSSYGAGAGSVVFDFYNANPGNYELTSPIIGNTPSGYALSFDYAYATFISEVDQLEILYSTNQGTSFTSLVLLNGGPTGILNTGGASNPQFAPTASQWGSYQILLPTGTNMIKFRGISAFGNDLYLDNINVAAPVPPSCATNLVPANAATNQFRDLSLTWQNGGGASSYDVYFDQGAGPATTLVSAAQASSTYTPAPLAANTQYSWRVVAKSLGGDAIGCSDFTFTTGTQYDYCVANHSVGCGNGDVINVTLNTLNSTSTCNPPAYQNFPASGATTTTVNLATSYNLSVTTDQSCIISVWMDWNHNGIFEASEWTQVATASTANVASTVSISIPPTAALGMTGMRIRSRFAGNTNDATSACISMGSGETEDYFITIGGCAAVVGSNNPVCELGDLNLTSTYYGAGTPATYSWTTTAVNPFTSSSPNPIINNVDPNHAGDYTVTITDNNGCTSIGTGTIAITPAPQLTTSGGGSICEGNGITLSVTNNALGQGTGNTYSWTTNALAPFTSSQQTPNVTSSAITDNSGDYTVVVTNIFLCTASVTENVIVNENPTLNLVSTQNVGCIGGNDGVITVSASGGSSPYVYSTDNFSTQNTTGVMNNLPSGPSTVEVQDGNNCSASLTASLTYTSTVPTSASVVVPFIGMPTNVCNGTTATLSIPAVSNATMYIWDAPAGSYFNGNVLNVSPFTTNTPSVTVTYGAPSGSLYVTGVQAANGCGGSLRKIQKTRGTISVPASISGSLTKCQNTTETYSIAAVDAATSYLWTITGDASVSGTGTSVTVTFGPAWNGGTLCVSAQTSCYTSPSKCIAISNSASTLNSISGSFSACPNSVLAYSVPASTGAATYNWTAPPGASVTSGAGTSNVSVTYSPGYSSVGSICVSVTSICGVTSALKCKTVAPGLPTVPSSITGALTGLCNQSIAYSCPSQGVGTTYTWTAPSGATVSSGQGTTSISVQYGPFSTGNVCVVANNACGSSSARCVPVKGAPNSAGAITANPSSWCAGDQVEFTVNTSALTGSYIINWSYPGPSVATYVIGGGNSSSLTLDWVTGTGNINVITSNACGAATKTSTWSSTCRQGELANVSSLTVFPNPTTDVINVTYSATKGHTDITVLDLAGRVVLTQNSNSVEGINNTQIKMSGLAKGAYLLQIQSTQGTRQVRVVVE